VSLWFVAQYLYAQNNKKNKDIELVSNETEQDKLNLWALGIPNQGTTQQENLNRRSVLDVALGTNGPD